MVATISGSRITTPVLEAEVVAWDPAANTGVRLRAANQVVHGKADSCIFQTGIGRPIIG